MPLNPCWYRMLSQFASPAMCSHRLPNLSGSKYDIPQRCSGQQAGLKVPQPGLPTFRAKTVLTKPAPTMSSATMKPPYPAERAHLNCAELERPHAVSDCLVRIFQQPAQWHLVVGGYVDLSTAAHQRGTSSVKA